MVLAAAVRCAYGVVVLVTAASWRPGRRLREAVATLVTARMAFAPP
jgi:hypothetical protein